MSDIFEQPTLIDNRDELPHVMQYGTVDTISFSNVQKYKMPDSGNKSYLANDEIEFYLETGGAQFLDTQDTYLSFTFTVTKSATVSTDQCMLDYNTDAIFYEGKVYINGELNEKLTRLNMFSNITDFLNNKSKHLVAVNYGVRADTVATRAALGYSLDNDTTHTVAVSNAAYVDLTVVIAASNADGTASVVNGQSLNVDQLGAFNVTSTAAQLQAAATPTVALADVANPTSNQLIGDPLFEGCIIKHDVTWIGGHRKLPRNGMPLTTATSYQFIWQPKSFYIGKWASKFFPLAFVKQLKYQLKLDLDKQVLTDISYTTASGALATGPSWTYAMSNTILNYTTVIVQKEMAAAIERAYIKNSLPHFLLSNTTYDYFTSQTFTTTNLTYTFNLNAASYESLIFAIIRDSDWTVQYGRPLSSYNGGITQFQCKINGQMIPQNRMYTDTRLYELYRQLFNVTGRNDTCNNYIKLPSNYQSGNNLGIGNNTTYYPQLTHIVANNTGGTTAATGLTEINGIVQVDEFNAPVLADGGANTDTGRRQGCTLMAVNLSNKRLCKDQNIKSGVAISGTQVELQVQFVAVNANCTVHCFAIKDTIVKYDGLQISTIS